MKKGPMHATLVDGDVDILSRTHLNKTFQISKFYAVFLIIGRATMRTWDSLYLVQIWALSSNIILQVPKI
jgi:hypothetical protein